ncbi:MAG: large subunit ribosomal protein [Acidimicrobiaceae bacterium]|nr:large subunit ribosomal protein [Acidimicrobiaceae bacterium]
MPHSVDVRTVDGSVSGSVTLDDAIFGVTPNIAVMHQVVTAQLAAARSGTQSTKTRAEVSGGGKKPFRQKGTGRARQGSTRAPHWTGGGVALGPKPRSYRQRTPRKMIQLALRSALSDRASEDRVMVMAEWPWTEPKTSVARAAVEALGLDGRILVVLDRNDDESAYKSFRNLPLIQVILTGELNAYDVLCNDWIVFTKATLPGAKADEGTDTVETPEAQGADKAPAPEPAAKAPEPAAKAPAAAEPAAEVPEPAAEAPAASAPEPAAEAPEPAAPEPAAEAPAAAEPAANALPAAKAAQAAEAAASEPGPAAAPEAAADAEEPNS